MREVVIPSLQGNPLVKPGAGTFNSPSPKLVVKPRSGFVMKSPHPTWGGGLSLGPQGVTASPRLSRTWLND